jgi:16S rRNA (cytosine1402-N4)-methyltransferase
MAERSPKEKSEKEKSHRPVLLQEVLAGLDVRPQRFYVDGTVGGGGHALAILERSSPDGRLLGIDWDPEALQRAGASLEPFGNRVLLRKGNYADMQEILASLGIDEVHGVLLDLGASYEQLTSRDRGFSFGQSGPLDMRFSPGLSVSARDIVNHWSEGDLRDLFKRYGEERWAGRIARAVVRSRPLCTTGELADLIVRSAPGRRGRLHPATRVFQALRIEVNRELENIRRGVQAGVKLLAVNGRVCVITYHSLEDRIVKQLFKELAGSESALRILTPKPMRPGPTEIHCNPRARSAKMRIMQRLE